MVMVLLIIFNPVQAGFPSRVHVQARTVAGASHAH